MAEGALSSPALVYDVTAKYHVVCVARPVTINPSALAFDTWMVCVSADGSVP
jgi:hypothetical protein